MGPDDTNEELSAEDQAAAIAAAESAFADGFDEENATGQSSGTPADPAPTAEPAQTRARASKQGTAAPAPSPNPTAAPAPAPATPVDPYAGLPETVRALLAQVPTLKHSLDSANGRIAAMQKRLEALPPAAPPAPPPAPLRPKLEAVRGELPEVADAIEEAFALRQAVQEAEATAAAATKAAATTPVSDDARTDEETLLDELHPNWVAKLGGNDFQLWLTQQSPEYANKVRSTGKAAVITDALAKFDVHDAVVKAAAQRAATLAASRHKRVVDAALPTRGNARPPATPPDEDMEAAFEAGFKGS